MKTKKIRVVVLSCDGECQDYLAQRAAEEFELVGVVRYIANQPKGSSFQRLRRYLNMRLLIEYLVSRLVLPAQDRRAQLLGRQLFWRAGCAPSVPEGVPLVVVDDINQPAVIKFLSEQQPDIVLVNGTNLLRRDILALAEGIPHGFLNLHTGLSPYARGGNCNLFALLEGHPEWVGITVHHVDPGIDRGDIVLSDQVPMDADDNYEMIELRGFHYGIEALLRAARSQQNSNAPRIKQWEKGKLFLKRTGHVYKPYHRVLVNRKIDNGLIRGYLSDRATRDAAVRLVGTDIK